MVENRHDCNKLLFFHRHYRSLPLIKIKKSEPKGFGFWHAARDSNS